MQMKTHGRRGEMRFVPIIFLFLLSSCSTKESVNMEIPSVDLKMEMKRISREMRQTLDDEFRLWYPLSLDTLYGGFYSDINYEWKLEGKQNKFVVTQARHVWSTANAAMFYQKDNTLRKVAEHGFRFLQDKMWDKQFGGFFDLVHCLKYP